LRYENGQYYHSHVDVADPEVHGHQDSMRMATVVMYLSDVEEGGETVFKAEGIDGKWLCSQQGSNGNLSGNIRQHHDANNI
jgi:prolyl 4-hydroxylase